MIFVPDSNKAPEFTDIKLVLLSNGITAPSKLRFLATVGLNMDKAFIDSALQNNKDAISEAAYTVLTQWRDSQKNQSFAYREICKALRRMKMDMLITKMNEEY